MPDPIAQQQDYVTAVLLAAIGEFGFALAGAGAIEAIPLAEQRYERYLKERRDEEEHQR